MSFSIGGFELDLNNAVHKGALGVATVMSGAVGTVHSLVDGDPLVQLGLNAVGIGPEAAAAEGFMADVLALAQQLATATNTGASNAAAQASAAAGKPG